jgi:hypothetical protein
MTATTVSVGVGERVKVEEGETLCVSVGESVGVVVRVAE